MGRMLPALESRSCGLPGLSKSLRASAIHPPDVRLVSRCGLNHQVSNLGHISHDPGSQLRLICLSKGLEDFIMRRTLSSAKSSLLHSFTRLQFVWRERRDC
jgi:hypothetical protein